MANTSIHALDQFRIFYPLQTSSASSPRTMVAHRLSPRSDVVFHGIETPRLEVTVIQGNVNLDESRDSVVDPPAPVAGQPVLYASVALLLIATLQYGWSTFQLNHSKFHRPEDCEATPVPSGTCLVFPGHSTAEWTWVVNLWIVGGMIGALGCGRVADRFGRKYSTMGDAVLMIVGALIQATAPNVYVFAIGRFVAGLASGAITTLCNGYINELAPPHLRNCLGALFQVATCVGLLLAGLSFFVGNTGEGWRYIAGFPIVFAVIVLLGAPRYLVESPAWLLDQGRHGEAEQVLARLFGEENVPVAMSWFMCDAGTPVQLEPAQVEAGATIELERDMEILVKQEVLHASSSPLRMLLSPMFRRQTLIALLLPLAIQTSGMNAIAFYSSTTFENAGMKDDRIGNLIVNIMNVLPAFAAGSLGARFGNRPVLITGCIAMLVFGVGLTGSLLLDSSALSIVFTSLFVAVFEMSLGPLGFLVIASLFPTNLRATGISLCLFVNWSGALAIGVGYPYVTAAVGDWGFAPFVVALAAVGTTIAFVLPETMGKTEAEIQALFLKR